MNRRDFCVLSGSAGLVATGLLASPSLAQSLTFARGEAISVPDAGWRLWIDREAPWQNDKIFLPDDVNLEVLPVNPPTGGWDRMAEGEGREVSLPATVEQFYWGKFGLRPYSPHEYSYAESDPVPENGAYCGVSWWWREIDIPADFAGRRILLRIRGARMRAEVYLNRKLVGYSIMEELPFDCDLTEAAVPCCKRCAGRATA